jgi:hypothetical protein
MISSDAGDASVFGSPTDNFFFEAIPEELDGSEASEVVTVHPTKSYVRPIPWAKVHGEEA